MAQPKKCRGKSSRTGKACKNYAMHGSEVCHAHGGRSPQVKAAARLRVAEARARAEFERLDIKPVDNPLAEIARITGEVVAWKDGLAQKVDELTSLEMKGAFGGEQVRVVVTLFERALDRCEKFLTAMARMNIDERLAVIQEHQAAVFIGAFERVLDVLELTAEQRERVAPAMRAELELIVGGTAA